METQLLHPLQSMHNAGSIMMYQYDIIVIENSVFPFTCKQEAHVLNISPLETVFENLQAKMEEKKSLFSISGYRTKVLSHRVKLFHQCRVHYVSNSINKSNLVKTLVGFIEVCWIQYYKTEGLKITCNNMKSNPCL